jgi:hypothetical protein
MHIKSSHLVPLNISFFLLLLLAGHASAQQQPCSDWYINKILKEMLNCSPQQIEDICSGRRPRPPENATDCSAPVPVAPLTGTPYEQFQTLAANSHIDLSQHPSYTEDYFENRAQLYCNLMSSGDFTQLTTAVGSPPVSWTETTNDRSRLEVAIMRVGTQAYCPQNSTNEQRFEQTYGR